jgi:putative serine protease PepD
VTDLPHGPEQPVDPVQPGGPVEPRSPFAPPLPGQAANPFAAPADYDPWASWAAPTGELPTAQIDTLGRPTARRRRPGRLVAAGLAVALVAGAAGGAVGAWAANRDSNSLTDSGASLGAVPQGTLSRPPGSVAGIAQRVLPTVVSIDVESGSAGDTGSGFILRSDGYILTNNHVVAAAAASGTISVQFNDGSTASAKIVGRSPSYDLAVLKVARSGLPVATLGDSDSVVVGDQSIAVGSPLGLAGTVTSGIISAVDRPVTTGESDGSERSYLSAIQTDAAINPGNSGGPLVDGLGRVIGVNSAIASLSSGTGQSGSIGVGFSIPINQARRVAEQIIRTGHATYPVIGAGLDPNYTGAGVRLLSVTAGGPSAAAGLTPGDVVTAADGKPITRAEELIVAIRTKQPGDVLTLAYTRGGSSHQAQVTLGSRQG